jgi:hypothetical protein
MAVSQFHRPSYADCRLAIASKRYVLFLHDEYDNPVLLQKGINNHEDRWSEHGLGHLRNPMNPDREDRDWIPQAWINIIRRKLRLPAQPLGFEHLPAMGRMPITNPTAVRSWRSSIVARGIATG